MERGWNSATSGSERFVEVDITGFTVKFWGTRGSVATPGEGTVRCGGNTPCVEVRCDSRVIVLDAGTGMRPLGLALEREGLSNVDVLISHAHMDHVQGFPFFNPAYNSGVNVMIHVPPFSIDPAEPFIRLMEAPHFPVVFNSLPATIAFHRLNGTCTLGRVKITTHPVNHPGGCYAYRLEFRGKSMVYLTDHEPYSRQTPGDAAAEEKDRAVREFIRGADLLVRETQYTREEYEQHRGWGHGTFEDALLDALDMGVKRLALFHHDPEHDDLFLENQLACLVTRKGNAELDVVLAREGQTVELI